MKFGFDVITLWSKNGEQRQLCFERNKVNVLTGESHTGKSALLDIFDYCFLASSHRLSDSIINENVEWYGVTFYINDKLYTIARRSPTGNKVSDEYYFSSTGSIPKIPTSNTQSDDIKRILEADFKIDEAVTIAYGGKTLKAGSKVSFRYFFLFNTISEDIITSRDVYFDKQSEERYQEALPRIFDLALGIDNLENIAAREKKEQLKKQISRLERKAIKLSDGRALFDEELRSLASKAASYGLRKIDDKDLSLKNFTDILREASAPAQGDALHERSNISAQIFDIERRLQKLRHFSDEYGLYKGTLRNTQDSLLPIEQLLKQAPTIIKSDIFDELISNIKSDLTTIKKSILGKQPVDGQISAIVKDLQNQKQSLLRKLETLPQEPQSFETEKEKWLFVGETIGKLNAYTVPELADNLAESSELESLQSQINSIVVTDVVDKREAVLSVINEIALDLLTKTAEVLANYSKYQPEFVYKEKRLRLRKPRSSVIENVGSSSNHMFLHLLHFLSLHEVAIGHKSPFIPSFLIIDQPSRPYYPDEKANDNVKISNSDSTKVHIAFKLLDTFITDINKNYETEFQMIVFEHVPRSTFEDMDNVHFLPDFRDGEALIPASWKH